MQHRPTQLKNGVRESPWVPRRSYMWGWIRYRNVFQRYRTHLTRYCASVSVVGDPGLQCCTFLYPIPNIGNCSDSECDAEGLGWKRKK
jgi:hypothetical protein